MIDALTALRCRPTLHDLAAEGCRVRLAWERTTWLGTAGPRDSRHRSGAGPPLDAGLPVEPLPSRSVTHPSLAASWSRSLSRAVLPQIPAARCMGVQHPASDQLPITVLRRGMSRSDWHTW